MMHALVLLCIKQTKFEMPSFINSKDMIGTKFKKRSHERISGDNLLLLTAPPF